MKTTGLTIIEAIQSGLPFKREKWEFYGKFITNLYFEFKNEDNKYDSFSLVPEDITAQDWQIKAPEGTITREKLEKAWHKSVDYNNPLLSDLIKELGL